MLKKILKNLLLKTGLYDRVRWSKMFYSYYHLKNPAAHADFLAEVKFYKALNLPERPLIFDIGANIGDKTMVFLKLAPKQIVQFEPDRKNGKILLTRYGRNPKIHLEPKAVSNEEGEQTFNILEEGSAFNTLSSKWRGILESDENRWHKAEKFSTSVTVQTTTLDKVIQQFGIPDYMKIDVEGYEEECLKGLTKEVPLVSLEANFPEFKPEMMGCAKKLYNINANYHFNISTDGQSFLFDQYVDYNEISEFLEKTDLKYFELFAYLKNNVNDN